MEFQQLGIEGAILFTPRLYEDDRGAFSEQFKSPTAREAIGHDFELAQVNLSTSKSGVIRGIHFAAVPPSQAKYVMCTSGSIYDVTVDLRIGSPTFGRWEAVQLDAANRAALYLAEGLGHAFMALEPSTVIYLCNQTYNPEREFEVHPLDPAIGIDWPDVGPISLSDKDAAAPTLAEAEQAGILPTHELCLEHQALLNSR